MRWYYGDDFQWNQMPAPNNRSHNNGTNGNGSNWDPHPNPDPYPPRPRPRPDNGPDMALKFFKGLISGMQIMNMTNFDTSACDHDLRHLSEEVMGVMEHMERYGIDMHMVRVIQNVIRNIERFDSSNLSRDCRVMFREIENHIWGYQRRIDHLNYRRLGEYVLQNMDHLN